MRSADCGMELPLMRVAISTHRASHSVFLFLFVASFLNLVFTSSAVSEEICPLDFLADDFPADSLMRKPNPGHPNPLPPDLGGWSDVITQEHILSGYVLYQKSWMAGHDQWSGRGDTRPGGDRFADGPKPEEIRNATTTIRTYCAHNEVLPIVLQMYALEDLRDVQVEITELLGAEEKIQRNYISIRWLLLSRNAAGDALPNETNDGWLVAPRPGHSMSADTMGEYWLLLWVPSDRPPGPYAGEITIRCAGKPDTVLNLIVEILPFEPDPSPYVHGFLHKGYYSLGMSGAYTQQLRHIISWGFNGDGIGESCSPPKERNADLSDAIDYLERCAVLGIRSPVWYSYASSVITGNIPAPLYRNPEWIVEHFQKLETELLDRPNLSDLIVCVADCPTEPEVLDYVIDKIVTPLMNLGLTRIHPAVIVDTQEAFDAAVGRSPVIFQNANCAGYAQNFGQGIQAASVVFDTDPGFSRAGYGMYLWRIAGEGCPGALSPIYGWNQHEFISPVDVQNQKYVHSVAWVSASVGVWDIRYVATLERLIAENPNTANAVEARAYLDEVYNTIEAAGGNQGRFRQMWLPEAYDTFRRDTAAYIMLLTQP